MPISINPQIMRQVIMDHYQNPTNKRKPNNGSYLSINMDSINCIDDIVIYLLIENDVIVDACFDGVACTISTASTDIMCDLLINKNKKEAMYIIEQYLHMIHEESFDDVVLGEAIVFANTYKQAARIKCATIGWDGAKEIINKDKHE